LNFNEFGLDPKLMAGIEAMNYDKATPVQEQVIPIILSGRDLIASAQTGTGKTAAFLLPIINTLITQPSSEEDINALVIVPTRELAVQIAQNLEGFSYFTPISSIAVYGGGDGILFEKEKKALSKGVDIVICTPGKMISHLAAGYVRIEKLKHLVLDEADRMLDMGFYDDIMKIISYIPAKRQTLLFSATMSPKMRKMGLSILHNPEQINISISKPPEKIIQKAYIVFEGQKIPLIRSILKDDQHKKIVVFCSRIDSVRKLSRELKANGIKNQEIHSGLEQTERENVLQNFKAGRTHIIVSTDVLSRGIDIDDIDLVINYDVPHDGEDYVHRIGRTARAETDGTAITLVSEAEQKKLLVIEKLLGNPIPKGILDASFGEVPLYQPEMKKRFSPVFKKKKFFKKTQI
jgi:ATP-dependent RNA helicase RhlE